MVFWPKPNKLRFRTGSVSTRYTVSVYYAEARYTGIPVWIKVNTDNSTSLLGQVFSSQFTGEVIDNHSKREEHLDALQKRIARWLNGEKKLTPTKPAVISTEEFEKGKRVRL